MCVHTVALAKCLPKFAVSLLTKLAAGRRCAIHVADGVFPTAHLGAGAVGRIDLACQVWACTVKP